jgi:hypothetical protein
VSNPLAERFLAEPTESDPDNSEALKRIAAGSKNLNEFMGKAVPVSVPEFTGPLPTPRVLSQAEIDAVALFAQVYGRITPETRRTLADHEVVGLISERQALDMVKDLVEARKDAIRTAVFNHLDVAYEARVGTEGTDGEGLADLSTDRSEEGHYLEPGEVTTADAEKRFTREIRLSPGPRLTAESLQELVNAGRISQEDFDAMVTYKPVLDPDKAMDRMKEHPELMGPVTEAITPGRKIAACYLRNR